ncbi:unnamed protein product [Orchesella dallaii]|uniref:Uncharacterized protein n=1 Tax=Orchesella dallaii TaxID=48710 RepID=A0ABP1RMU2_9HEXA
MYTQTISIRVPTSTPLITFPVLSSNFKDDEFPVLSVKQIGGHHPNFQPVRVYTKPIMTTQSGPMQGAATHSSMEGRKTWKVIHLSHPTLQNTIATTKRTARTIKSSHDLESSSKISKLERDLNGIAPTINSNVVQKDTTTEIAPTLSIESSSTTGHIEHHILNPIICL